jgi:hypothetical protein
MKRRTALIQVVIMLVGLAVAVPQPVFAQSDPFVGTWQLNLAKSKFPGPPVSRPAPKSQTDSIQAEGQGLKVTATGVGPEGNPISNGFALVFDWMPHPSGNPSTIQSPTRG